MSCGGYAMRPCNTLATALIALAVVFGGAAAAQQCALYVKDGQVCFTEGEAPQCVTLMGLENVGVYRCLIADVAELKDCEVTWLAQNRRMYLRPLKIHRTHVAYVDRDGKILSDARVYSADKIKSSCRPLRITQ